MKAIKQFGFTPILGWSASRYDTFMACRRQYFYNYYAKYDKDHPKHKIDALKRMTSIPLETGNIVHDIIEVLLNRLVKTTEAIHMERFFDYIRRMTEDYCSKKVFMEVYYRELSSIDVDEIFRNAQTCLNNFLTGDRFEWLVKKAVPEKENWIIEPGGYGETRIDSMKAYCKVDFLFPLKDRVFILDWKTGKPNDAKHRKQLLGYASWASYHLSKKPAQIVPIIAYLRPDYVERELAFNEFDIQEFTIQVRKETDEMYAYCRDVQENIPEDKTEFVKTSNPNICAYCNFRELCNSD